MLNIRDGRYVSPDLRRSGITMLIPSLVFYANFLWLVLRSGFVAWRGRYDDKRWEEGSRSVVGMLEAIGVKIEVEGFENIEKVKGPVIFIGNHMSMMETLVLPSLIRPFKPVTFVIKESLLHYPVFKYIMASRNPIAVSRTNPRQDLKTVLTEGCARLENGISVVVFPQTTRALQFKPEQMSSIGVKLAQKAKATIIPVALKTDAWQNGTLLKDFGRITRRKKTRFAFGQPMTVEGKGTTEQQLINTFIASKLKEWED
jgi:1-acyl-sn-glycerol-3-phosphate acyltransferase